jgi:hypothetical protein
MQSVLRKNQSTLYEICIIRRFGIGTSKLCLPEVAI